MIVEPQSGIVFLPELPATVAATKEPIGKSIGSPAVTLTYGAVVVDATLTAAQGYLTEPGDRATVTVGRARPLIGVVRAIKRSVSKPTATATIALSGIAIGAHTATCTQPQLREPPRETTGTSSDARTAARRGGRSRRPGPSSGACRTLDQRRVGGPRLPIRDVSSRGLVALTDLSACRRVWVRAVPQRVPNLLDAVAGASEAVAGASEAVRGLRDPFSSATWRH